MLNEDEHGIKPENGPAYTTCYDAIKVEVEKVNKKVMLVGPEIVGGAYSVGYMEYFLKAENHADKQAPPVASYHWFGGMVNNNTAEEFMTRCKCVIYSVLLKLINQLPLQSQVILIHDSV